jgi:glycosyltransferase involved in cell wall biosynthesis
VIPVSVVIPAYQAEEFIGAALASVASGKARPAEVIVVDDASTDRTRAIATAAGARVIAQPRNLGPSAARNAGVDAASSQWVAFLDADDVWFPDKLALQWEALQRWPDAGLCFTDYDAVYADGRLRPSETTTHAGYNEIRREARVGSAVRFESSAFVAGLVRSMFVCQSSVVVNRALFLRCGGYDPRYRLAEDYDLFIRLVGNAPAIAIERPLLRYRRHAASLTADPLAQVRSIDALWEAILERPERYPPRAVALIRRRRIGTLQGGIMLALRLGRFDDALPFLAKVQRLDPSASSLALSALCSALRNPVGQTLHGMVRNAWRRRPGTAYR